MKIDNDLEPSQTRPRGLSQTNSHYGSAAIATSCQPPLPIYPHSDEEETSPRPDKDTYEALERYSTRGSGPGNDGPTIDEPLTKRKKSILLALFCLGVFMDGEFHSGMLRVLL
jgi:hypothetical protein